MPALARRARRPRAKSPAVERFTNAKFARAVGVSLRAVAYMAREDGAPHDAGGWIFPDCIQWHQRRAAAKAKRDEKPDDVRDAHRRQALADARLAELKVARELEELIPRDTHRAALRDAFFRVAAKLRNLPPRLAGVAIGIRTPGEAQSRFEPLIDELLSELYAGDDVPVGDDDSDS